MTMPDPNATPQPADPNATPPVAPPATTDPAATDPAATSTPPASPDVIPPVAVDNPTTGPAPADTPSTPAPAHDDAPAHKVGDLVVRRWHDRTEDVDHEHYGIVVATGTYVDADESEVQAARFAWFPQVTGFVPLDELHALDDEA